MALASAGNVSSRKISTHLPWLRESQLGKFALAPHCAAFAIHQACKWRSTISIRDFQSRLELRRVIGRLVLAVHGPDIGCGFLLSYAAGLAVQALGECWCGQTTGHQRSRGHRWPWVLLAGWAGDSWHLGWLPMPPAGVCGSGRSARARVTLFLFMPTGALLSPAGSLSCLAAARTMCSSGPVRGTGLFGALMPVEDAGPCHVGGRWRRHGSCVVRWLGWSGSATLSFGEEAGLVRFLHWGLGNWVLRDAHQVALVGMAGQEFLHLVIVTQCVLDSVGQGITFVGL